MLDLLPLAQKIAAILKERRETIAVAESSTGGILSAALLAVPGASAYFLGGAVVYTRRRGGNCSTSRMKRWSAYARRASRYALLPGRYGSVGVSPRPGASPRRGGRTDRQPVRRCRGSFLSRRRRAARAGSHHRDRRQRPPDQHANLRGGRARSSRTKPGNLTEIYVDADDLPGARGRSIASPTAWVWRSSSSPTARVPSCRRAVPGVTMIIVGDGADAADDWIAERITAADICVTSDIPLASRCLVKGARALSPIGKPWTEANIGSALAGREVARHLRGTRVSTGGPPPFGKADRSRFLSALDNAVQAARRS